MSLSNKIVFSIFFFIWFTLFRPISLLGPASYIIVSGISMEPTLLNGDLVILQRKGNYSIGDIIAYRVPGGQVIHRVIGGDSKGYLTQGDNKQIIDPWKPTNKDVLGKMWFFIPKAGSVVQILRHPANLAAIGLLGVFVFFNEPEKRRKKNRRGTGMGLNNQDNMTIASKKAQINKKYCWTTNIGYTEFVKSATMLLIILFSVLLATALYLGYLGFSMSVEKVDTLEVVKYEHLGTYNYKIYTQRSNLYPQGFIESPMIETKNEEAMPIGTMVFTRLAKSMDINFIYRLDIDRPAELEGELRPFIQLWSYDNLIKSEPLSQVVVFDGNEVSTQISLEMAQIERLGSDIVEETGVGLGRYKIVVLSIVNLSGTVEGRTVDEHFSPALTFYYDPDQISFENKLQFSEEKVIEEEVIQPQNVSFFGITFPIQQARRLSIILGLFSLVIVGLSACVQFLGWGLPESEKIHIRHGSMIVDVAKTRLQNSPAVRVVKIDDLVKVAERTGSVICHVEQLEDTHFYFVPDAQVVYTYAIGKKTPEGKAECDDS